MLAHTPVDPWLEAAQDMRPGSRSATHRDRYHHRWWDPPRKLLQPLCDRTLWGRSRQPGDGARARQRHCRAAHHGPIRRLRPIELRDVEFLRANTDPYFARIQFAVNRATLEFAVDSALEETGLEPSVPLLRRCLSNADAGPISWMGSLSTKKRRYGWNHPASIIRREHGAPSDPIMPRRQAVSDAGRESYNLTSSGLTVHRDLMVTKAPVRAFLPASL
jgi:hypothetical protein